MIEFTSSEELDVAHECLKRDAETPVPEAFVAYTARALCGLKPEASCLLERTQGVWATTEWILLALMGNAVVAVHAVGEDSGGLGDDLEVDSFIRPLSSVTSLEWDKFEVPSEGDRPNVVFSTPVLTFEDGTSIRLEGDAARIDERVESFADAVAHRLIGR